jgi:hypothetical protein
MTSEREQTPSSSSSESDENQLCLSCMFPNESLTHFCAKCGAPLSSYASTGPFERVFAEGHVFRQAVEQPRSFIVVLGIWILFGMAGLSGVYLIAGVRNGEFGSVFIGAMLLAISFAMITKTTRNYSRSRKSALSR